MSATPARVCLLLVISLYADHVLAVAHCDMTIIEKIKTTEGCYKNGYRPKQWVVGQRHGTITVLSQGDVPENTRCVEVYYQDSKTRFSVLLNNGTYLDSEFNHLEFRRTHILEIDNKGVYYKRFMMQNDKDGYAYYRCIATKGLNGNGKHEFGVVYGCNHVKQSEMNEEAQECFEAIGIKEEDIAEPTPCYCFEPPPVNVYTWCGERGC